MASPGDTGQPTGQHNKAIERGIKQYDRMLVGWLTSKFGDPDLAEDLAQDTYIRVWRYAESNTIDNLKALLFKTAANLAANEFRSRARRRVAMGTTVGGDSQQQIDLIACDSPSPERTLLAKAEAKQSLDAIYQLPERQRRAFVMNRFEGKNYSQIAETLGVSVSSVEKYIIAALSALRVAMSNDAKPSNTIPFPRVGKVAKDR